MLCGIVTVLCRVATMLHGADSCLTLGLQVSTTDEYGANIHKSYLKGAGLVFTLLTANVTLFTANLKFAGAWRVATSAWPASVPRCVCQLCGTMTPHRGRTP
jgi:hypothetical protein